MNVAAEVQAFASAHPADANPALTVDQAIGTSMAGETSACALRTLGGLRFSDALEEQLGQPAPFESGKRLDCAVRLEAPALTEALARLVAEHFAPAERSVLSLGVIDCGALDDEGVYRHLDIALRSGVDGHLLVNYRRPLSETLAARLTQISQLDMLVAELQVSP